MNDTGAAANAANINSRLMAEAAQTGMPALRATTDYATRSIDAGLPEYVNRGYRGAATQALEQAIRESQQSRVAALSGGKFNAARLNSYQGAAEAAAKEKAGIAVSKAAATVSNRNNLLRILGGAGAQTTSLSTQFGGLTNRALAAGLGQGNAAYEGAVGGAAAITPLLLQLLERNPNSFSPQVANLAYRSGDASAIASNISRVPLL